MTAIPPTPAQPVLSRLTRILLTCGLLALPALGAPALAEAPQVAGVSVQKEGMGWRFFVTLSHDDTGWDHYADAWDILDATGAVLATRTLHHPHVHEQPFTRSLGPVILPDGTREVFVRGRCSKGAKTKTPTRVEIGF